MPSQLMTPTARPRSYTTILQGLVALTFFPPSPRSPSPSSHSHASSSTTQVGDMAYPSSSEDDNNDEDDDDEEPPFHYASSSSSSTSSLGARTPPSLPSPQALKPAPKDDPSLLPIPSLPSSLPTVALNPPTRPRERSKSPPRGRSRWPRLLWNSEIDEGSLKVLHEYHRRALGTQLPKLEVGKESEWSLAMEKAGL